MNWTIVGIAIAAIGTIWAIVSGMNSNIEKRIQQQFKDPEFIKKIADQVRLPFIIFDENERFLNNSGGDEYIENIKVSKNVENEIVEVVVVGKKFLNSPPILQNIDGNIQFHDPERIDQTGWKFIAAEVPFVTFTSSTKGERPPHRFKIEIIP